MTAPALFADESDAAPTSGTASARRETQSLYRRYRPQSFEAADLVGQDHVVRTLRNAIALDRIAHAYLFCGPRGTGKTSTARLLAKAINCLDADPARRPCNNCDSCRAINAGSATDVIEIDAASNRGIDDIRELRERVKYAPVQLRTKIYIIDEAHQITGAAANAFLKTLEEPPGHTKFILATTDPEELLPTIVSRCQRFDFRRIGLETAVEHLARVAKSEGLEIEPDALAIIARHATGSMRDALGLLDQLAVYREGEETASTISADLVRALLGVSRNERVESIVEALAARDASAALGAVNEAAEAGDDPRQLNRQLVAYLRVLLHERAGGSLDADERARSFAARFDLRELSDLARRFSEVDYRLKHSSYGHLPLEVALVDAVLRNEPASAAPRAAAAESRSVPAAPDAGDAVPPQRAADPVEFPPVPRDEPAPAARPTTSLRDWVRGASARPAAPVEAAVPADNATSVAEPATIHQDPPAATSSRRGDDAAVDQLADLWPRIRSDVKAVNRRIEALLSSVDPVLVEERRVVLAAAYPFHRDKLNTDDVRHIVADAISRRLDRKVDVWCVLRGEEPTTIGSARADVAPVAEPAAKPASPASASTDEASETPSPAVSADLDDDERRLRAAKNIFDAEEIGTVG